MCLFLMYKANNFCFLRFLSGFRYEKYKNEQHVMLGAFKYVLSTLGNNIDIS